MARALIATVVHVDDPIRKMSSSDGRIPQTQNHRTDGYMVRGKRNAFLGPVDQAPDRESGTRADRPGFNIPTIFCNRGCPKNNRDYKPADNSSPEHVVDG